MKWKTEPTTWDELIQVTDDYVVHARGFTIDEDIWLDEYSLRLGHHRCWNDLVRHEYGYPKWPDNVSWTLYSAQNIDRPAIYWSIIGDSMFTVQYPRLRNMGRERFALVEGTLEALEIDPDAEVRLENIVEEHEVDSDSHAKSIVSPGGSGRSEQVRYKQIDGLESVKWI